MLMEMLMEVEAGVSSLMEMVQSAYHPIIKAKDMEGVEDLGEGVEDMEEVVVALEEVRGDMGVEVVDMGVEVAVLVVDLVGEEEGEAPGHSS